MTRVMEYSSGGIPDWQTVNGAAEFDEIRWRMYAATGCTTVFELAAFLETTPAHISDARRQLRIPDRWFQHIFLKTGVDPLWIKNGVGEG